MEGNKYICKKCQETLDLQKASGVKELRCPRCFSGDVDELVACSLEVGPPPWEYSCPKCKIRFSVKAPCGPDEAKMIRCPVCDSINAKWIALTSEACPPGG